MGGLTIPEVGFCRWLEGCRAMGWVGEWQRDQEAVPWVQVVDNGVSCCDNRHGTERKERKVHMGTRK